MKAVLVALGALLLVVACGAPISRPLGSSSTGPIPNLGPGFDLFVADNPQGDRGLAVVDAGSGRIERRLPTGVLSADGKVLFSLRATSLLMLDSATGAQQNELKLGRSYELPAATLGGLRGGFSPNRRWLVLQSFEPQRLPADRSFFTLIDTTLKEKARSFELAGFFTFDGLDNSARNLYLNHYQGQTYKVELFDVARGRLAGYSVTDKTEPGEQMSGVRLGGVFSPDGAWQYSVYLNQSKGPSIHALNLNGAFAWCIDLPIQDKAGESQFMWALAIDSAGRNIYATNAALGTVSVVTVSGSDKPRVSRTVHVGAAPQARSLFWKDAEAKRMVSSVAALSPDGRTLYFGDTDLVAVDTTTLQVRSRSLSGWRLQSLAASPDGVWLFALGESGPLARIEIATARLAQQFGTGLFPMGFVGVTARA